MTQEQINALLVEKATPASASCRLKGGDPFIFGRGGEECQALAEAGIRFEVVPGITAAIAAPAYAGIPVTHRDFNSSFTFITGHEKEEEYKDAAGQSTRSRAPAHRTSIGRVIAKLPCVAFYMGVKSLPRICAQADRTRHVARHARRRHSLGNDAADSKPSSAPSPTLAAKSRRGRASSPPAITIIGKVVSLRATR